MRLAREHLAALLTALLFLTGCGTPAASPAPVTAPPPTPAATPTPAPRPTLPGDKIDVGGYRLYLDCKGEGSPAVILEAGLEGDATTWKDVHPQGAQFTRVCRYDRAGLAHSDYGPTPRDAERTAQDLHTLLTLANIPPPYILVGHSFGGLLIRRYQHDFPEEVTGMIFVDAVHEDWWEQALALLPPASADEPARLASFRLYLTAGWRDPANNFEAMDIPAVVAQVRETNGLGALPVTVLTAENFTVLNPGLPPDLEQALANLFREQQARLAALSTNGRQTIVPETGHNIPRQNPAVVVEAIRAMIEGQ
ncbi:MAG: alpha/beta fold hydrolase [Chloroflexota bacterium]